MSKRIHATVIDVLESLKTSTNKSSYVQIKRDEVQRFLGACDDVVGLALHCAQTVEQFSTVAIKQNYATSLFLQAKSGGDEFESARQNRWDVSGNTTLSKEYSEEAAGYACQAAGGWDFTGEPRAVPELDPEYACCCVIRNAGLAVITSTWEPSRIVKWGTQLTELYITHAELTGRHLEVDCECEVCNLRLT